jgi:3-dehydroquinate synthetase
VTGDLTGFAAATFKRAMGFIQLPTSLLAMVDSSVGGKTGVNLAAGKNLIGAFHQPLAVFCDSDFLETLPDGRRMDGMGEVLKYAILGDQALFERLEKEPSRPVGEKEIAACLAMKQRIVEQDEREQGLRKYLNLGHTFGHAIEQASGYARSHGWAVATGIAMAARLSKNFNHLAAADCARIEALVSAMGYDLHAGFPAADLVAAILSDKKIAGDEIDLILPVSTCRCLAKRVSLAVLREEVERVR